MVRRSAFAVIALAAAFASAPAAAQSNFYGVANIGSSTIDVDPSSVNAFAIANGTAVVSTVPDNHDLAFKLQLGYRFSNNYALEGGYTDLGKAGFTTVTAAPSTVGGKKEAYLFNLDLVGTWPLNQTFSLLGRFGIYYWETKSILPFGAGTIGIKDTSYDFKLGAGVQYELSKTVALRAEYERLNGVGSATTTGDSKINMLSVGAVLKF
ncbi:MAG: outer membrane beta-barrel protein [Betaproteobacteria bacterium]|nr:outer membrane beta-barrel protein [Betaproteobacteria bacterium]